MAKRQVSVGVDEHAEVRGSKEREPETTRESDLAAVVVRKVDCSTEVAAKGLRSLREQVAATRAHGTEPHRDGGQVEGILSRDDGAVIFDHCDLTDVLCRPGNRAQCLALRPKLTNRTEIARALQLMLQPAGPGSAERMGRFEGSPVDGRA